MTLLDIQYNSHCAGVPLYITYRHRFRLSSVLTWCFGAFFGGHEIAGHVNPLRRPGKSPLYTVYSLRPRASLSFYAWSMQKGIRQRTSCFPLEHSRLYSVPVCVM